MHFLIYPAIAIVSFVAGMLCSKVADSEMVATENDLKTWAAKLEAAFIKDKAALAADVSSVITSIKSKLP